MDHSQLGAQEAASFCLHHGMSQYDAGIVSWLVDNHLLMSVTAQRRDISRPFRHQSIRGSGWGSTAPRPPVSTHGGPTYERLIPIYGTDWKDTLLKDLYEATEYALARGLETPIGQGGAD